MINNDPIHSFNIDSIYIDECNSNDSSNFLTFSLSTTSQASEKKGVKRAREDGCFEVNAKIQKIGLIRWCGKELCDDVVRHVTLFLDFRSLNRFEQSHKAHRTITDLAWRELRLQAGFKMHPESQNTDKPEKWSFLIEHRLNNELKIFVDIFAFEDQLDLPAT
ncbi:hypothetical protein PNK_0918 [Candidatus Protochlamydia naegleriophila]|uniref:Uncharacterized protein n=1 Tax=Candidatus Protochlamydia naegleriophila TaxID=389348 RepID=A0A0U5JDR8_9BACT|nr:hypothetical protein [Candidatus Protochlamydia naegleriophila]CUI16543.1 hypothetical protein PNK_0918 [Candidatus Protochlamydia naegleriophila]